MVSLCESLSMCQGYHSKFIFFCKFNASYRFWSHVGSFSDNLILHLVSNRFRRCKYLSLAHGNGCNNQIKCRPYREASKDRGEACCPRPGGHETAIKSL